MPLSEAQVHEHQLAEKKAERIKELQLQNKISNTPRARYHAALKQTKPYLPHKTPVESLMWPTDFKALYEALNFNMPGKVSTWYNPQTEITYTVTPRGFKYPVSDKLSVQPCRIYRFIVQYSGTAYTHVKQACRKEDRTWVIQK